MGIYSEVAYGILLDEDICDHYSITDKHLGQNSSFESFSFLVSLIMSDDTNLICVDPDDRGISNIYYAIYKNDGDIDSVMSSYKDSILNLDNEFNIIFEEMDRLIKEDLDMEEEFCYMIFDSPNYEEAKKKFMELKDIIIKSNPDFISIQSCG